MPKKTSRPSAKPVKAVPKKYPRLRLFIRWFGLPALVYFVMFCLFTWPWISHFNGYYFTDQGDGLQNVWNMWWIHKAVTQLHQLPWSTGYLHYPFGVTLIGQTLNPFNGFVALALLPILKLNQAYNIMVIFSFVMGGVSAFWLCRYFSKSYVASLIGGMIFTFSSYHFAHAEGHMQLVSLEWIPLFVLLWWKFVKRPTYWLAAGVAVSLLLVLFCDYYYFLYSVMTAGGIVVYLWFRHEMVNLKDKQTWGPLVLLGLLGLVLIAPLPGALLLSNHRDMLTGSHSARMFSTDILTPLIDGGFWRFHTLTNGYWRYVPANVFESTIYVTLSVFTVLVISVVKRTKFNRDLLFWQLLVIVFGVFSLGPRLLVRGNTVEHIILPYVVLERIVPGMKLSGMPIRMMIMVTLGSAVIVAMVLAKPNLHRKRDLLLLGLFVVVWMFEIWPSPLPLTSNQYPAYVAALKNLPSGAVLDEAAASEPQQLYHQTLDDKQIPLGYISRAPQSLGPKEYPFMVDNAQNKLDRFCPDFKVRYLTEPASKPRQTNFPIIYQDSTAIIYDLKDAPNC